jgi:hypothetical protein
MMNAMKIQEECKINRGINITKMNSQEFRLKNKNHMHLIILLVIYCIFDIPLYLQLNIKNNLIYFVIVILFLLI